MQQQAAAKQEEIQSAATKSSTKTQQSKHIRLVAYLPLQLSCHIHSKAMNSPDNSIGELSNKSNYAK